MRANLLSQLQVTVAVNGLKAWQLLQHPDSPSLIILDWMMPEMDGIEVLKRVRTLPTNKPPYPGALI